MLKKEKILFGAIGVSFGFYLASEFKNLYFTARLEARKEALEFAREHRLGGTLLDVGKALIDFHGERIQDMFLLGFLTGVLMILASVFYWIFFNQYTNNSEKTHTLPRKEYLQLKDKAYLYDEFFNPELSQKSSQKNEKNHHESYRESERETTKI